MHCKDVLEQLSAFHDRELANDNRKIVTQHVGNCTQCAEVLKLYEKLSQLCKVLLNHEPPAHDWTAIEAIVQPARPAPQNAYWNSMYKLTLGISALAVVLLLAMLLFPVRRNTSHSYHADPSLTKNMEEFLNLRIERANHFENIAAIGAAIKAIEEDNDFVFDIEQLDQVAAYSREKRKYAPALSLSLEKVNNQSKKLAPRIKEGTEVVLGIDGGSTTTKGALVDLETGR